MSESRFLPEALGPGCAFLDYDNDGWMDIFLVNSGPSDFWKPPSLFAMRFTKTIATEPSPMSPRRPESAGRISEWESRLETTITTAGPTSS